MFCLKGRSYVILTFGASRSNCSASAVCPNVLKIRAFTFIYSKRTGTPAAAMENQVPEDVVKDRFNRLLNEVQTIAAKTCAVHQDTVQTVLTESVCDHDASMVTGRLSNNLLVHFPGSADLIGKLVPVYLAECKGFYYLGRLAE